MNNWNNLLPNVVRDDVAVDEQESLKQIELSIEQIQSVLIANKSIVANKDVGKLMRQIHVHSILKYNFEVSEQRCILDTVIIS